MIQEMLSELKRFAMGIGLVVAVFILFGRICQRVFMFEPTSLADTFLDVFDGFNGNQNY